MENQNNQKNIPPPMPYRNKSLTNLHNEKWVPVPLWEKYFHISNYGRVKRLARVTKSQSGRERNLKEQIMLPALNKSYNNYKKDFIYALQSEIVLDGNTSYFQPHRMVYYCFVEKFDLNDPEIIIVAEGNGLDIRPHKLLKISQVEKTHRMYELGRQPSPFNYEDYSLEQLSSPTGKAKLKPISQYDENGELVRCYKDITEAAELSGIAIKKIREGAKVLVSMPKGFYWRYGNDPSLDVDIIADIIAMEDVLNMKDAHNKYVEFMKG